jgi:hypothetical protein
MVCVIFKLDNVYVSLHIAMKHVQQEVVVIIVTEKVHVIKAYVHVNKVFKLIKVILEQVVNIKY